MNPHQRILPSQLDGANWVHPLTSLSHGFQLAPSTFYLCVCVCVCVRVHVHACVCVCGWVGGCGRVHVGVGEVACMHVFLLHIQFTLQYHNIISMVCEH